MYFLLLIFASGRSSARNMLLTASKPRLRLSKRMSSVVEMTPDITDALRYRLLYNPAFNISYIVYSTSHVLPSSNTRYHAPFQGFSSSSFLAMSVSKLMSPSNSKVTLSSLSILSVSRMPALYRLLRGSVLLIFRSIMAEVYIL